MYAGQALGEEEMLQGLASYKVTAVTSEVVELMEVEKEDFDRILRTERNARLKQVSDFLSGLSFMKGVSADAVRILTEKSTRRSYSSNQIVLAHPPDRVLGSASYSESHICVFWKGEAELCGMPGTTVAAATKSRPPLRRQGSDLTAAAQAEMGPHLVDKPPPSVAVVERHLGGSVQGIATLGSGELVTDNLVPQPRARWFRRATIPVEILVISRRDWVEAIGLSINRELRDLALARQAFFQSQLDQCLQLQKATEPVFKRHLLSRPNSAAPKAATGMTLLEQLKRYQAVEAVQEPRNHKEPAERPASAMRRAGSHPALGERKPSQSWLDELDQFSWRKAGAKQQADRGSMARLRKTGSGLLVPGGSRSVSPSKSKEASPVGRRSKEGESEEKTEAEKPATPKIEWTPEDIARLVSWGVE